MAIVTEVGTNGTVTTASGDWEMRLTGNRGSVRFHVLRLVRPLPRMATWWARSRTKMGMYLSAFVAPVGVHSCPWSANPCWPPARRSAQAAN